MGGETGTGTKTLEEKAVEIEVQGDIKKVVEIKGLVDCVKGSSEPIFIPPRIAIRPRSTYLTGYKRNLHITLDPKSSGYNIRSIKFEGTSSVKGGDMIKAGLILEENRESYEGLGVLYIEILDNDFFVRRDLMDGCGLMHKDARKLGIN